MAASCIGAKLIFFAVLPWVATSDSGGKFLGFSKKMNAACTRSELQGVLGEVLGCGHGIETARLNQIRSVLSPMFQSLPKNKKGNIAAPVMRYVVRRYFSQQNAWVVKGFEPHADSMDTNATDVNANVVRGKAPAFLRSVLEDQFKYEGFAFDDIVAMVAALERLTFDEVVKSVELSFNLNSYPIQAELTRSQLMEVISSYLITEMLEGTDNKDQHVADKESVRERYPNWDTTYIFLVDVISSYIYERRNAANPFIEEPTYSFEDAAKTAELVSEQFGPWSNHECHDMRDMLLKFDVHQTGRVKISDFYRSTVEGAWQFLEPTEFLRQNGALDESSASLGPQVIIANYISGMSNCITSSPYYAICCLNDCDQVFRHMEERIASPTATTSQIMDAVDSMPQEANVTPDIRKWLADMAALHEDRVPVHGRLLAQWLHFVFPHECPYPHMSGLNPMTQEQWRSIVGEEGESVSEEEVRQHFEAESSRRPISEEAGREMWILQETLMESSTPSDNAFTMSKVSGLIMLIGMIGSFGFLVFEKIHELNSNPKHASLKPSGGKSIEYSL